MALPTPDQVSGKKGDVTKDKNHVKADEDKIKKYQSDIKGLEDKIQVLHAGLPKKQLDAENAEADAEKMLRDIEEEIGLDIKAMESSVLQGGTATFEAEYDKTELPAPGHTLHDLHVQLLWNTGGCTIKTGGIHSETITVDTSSVEPGDYGIGLSLTFI
jgi:hypothetical protein